MLEIHGVFYGAKCVGCSTELTVWARDVSNFWHCILVSNVVKEIIGDSIVEPERLDKMMREALGKMGGIFCPSCMPIKRNKETIEAVSNQPKR